MLRVRVYVCEEYRKMCRLESARDVKENGSEIGLYIFNRYDLLFCTSLRILYLVSLGPLARSIESIIPVIRKSAIITQKGRRSHRCNNSLIFHGIRARVDCVASRTLSFHQVNLVTTICSSSAPPPSPRHDYFGASTVMGCNVGKMRARLPSIDSISASG